MDDARSLQEGQPVDAIDVISAEPLIDQPAIAPGEAVTASTEVMTRDDFFVLTMGIFPIANGVLAMQTGQPPLKSLGLAPTLPTARPASDALYTLAEKLPWMHFLIEKDAMWMMGLVAIGAFGSQVYNAVMIELHEREQSRIHQNRQPMAA